MGVSVMWECVVRIDNDRESSSLSSSDDDDDDDESMTISETSYFMNDFILNKLIN